MTLINPADSVERQNEKLVQIAQSLMRRVEQKSDDAGLAYQQFERAALLETQVRDRTHELERALDLLQESNARLEVANIETETARANLTEAIETVNEGFALFDPGERLVLFNSRFCQDILDVSDHLAEGVSFEDYIRLISRSRYLSLPRDQSPQDWAARRLALHSDDHVVFNVRLTSKRWMQVSEHRTARGGTVILQTDVTEIMRHERLERDKQRDQQARMLQATLDHLNQGVCIFDDNQALVGWNKNMDGLLALPSGRTIHGLQFSEIIDRMYDELIFHDGFDQTRLGLWANQTKRRAPISFEITRNKSQTFRVFAQEMPDRGFVISFTDVTAEHEAAAALSQMNARLEKGVRERTTALGVALAEAERANASKSRFVAAASHDLLQPLSAAKLFVSSLNDRIEDAGSLSILQRAETALVGVENIIEALLDISRLDAGKAVFDIQPVRLSAILSPLRDELSPAAAAKGLVLAIEDSDATVRSDPGYLRRIIQNLITNAIKYTDAGRVDVTVRHAGDSVQFAVSDTGPGIAPQDQALIFQEFERRDSTSGAPGLGLGLAIVDRACLGLNHPLSLTSQLGQGSRFSLELALAEPLRVDDALPLERVVTPDSALVGTIVLLVENDVELAAATALMLEEQGGEVLLAHSAEEAADLLKEIELIPDFLLLDNQLGAGRSGAEFYCDIRDTVGPIPAVIVSADRSSALADQCDQIGVPLMSKPLDRVKLLDLINNSRGG